MVDVRGDVLRPPHGTTPAAVKANKIQKLSSFKSNEDIHKREDGSYYVVSANKLINRTNYARLTVSTDKYCVAENATCFNLLFESYCSQRQTLFTRISVTFNT